MRAKKYTLYILLSLSLIQIGGAHAQKKTVVLGQSAAFTGSSRSLGIELWRGSEAYFRHVNESKLLGPYQIKVESLDDYYEGDQALLNTIELVRKKKVFGLFGYVGTPTIVRALPAVQKLNQDEDIFLFSNYTGAGPQRHFPYENFVFNVRASYEEETSAIIDKMIAAGYKRIGLFIQNDAYGRSGAHGVTKALAKYRMAPAFEATYTRGQKATESMSKQVTDLIEAKVDAVVAISSYEASAAFIRDARLSGLGAIIANVSFVGADQLLHLLKSLESKHQINLTDNIINTQVVPPWEDTSVPLVAEYQELMKKYSPMVPPKELIGSVSYTATGSEFGFTSLEGFINAKLFTEILKRYLKSGGSIQDRKAFTKFIKKLPAIDIGLDHKFGPLGTGNQFSHVVYFTEVDPEKKNYRSVKNWERFAVDSFKRSQLTMESSP